MNKYFLSFDCATKTLGYVFIKIVIPKVNINECKEKMILIKHKPEITKEDLDTLIEYNTMLNNTIQIIDSDCIDLCPGVANKDITTIDRIKKTTEFVNKKLLPLIESLDVTILVEFQMSQNTQSKIVSIVLLTLFAKYECHLVYPSLKNKVNFTKEGHYSKFIPKYKKNYTANKQHALQNFKDFELLFNQVNPISNKLKGHIADAFMQIFGFIMFPSKRITNY